ncbi:hypothetical protein [Streptomyces lavendofoliae]
MRTRADRYDGSVPTRDDVYRPARPGTTRTGRHDLDRPGTTWTDRVEDVA